MINDTWYVRHCTWYRIHDTWYVIRNETPRVWKNTYAGTTKQVPSGSPLGTILLPLKRLWRLPGLLLVLKYHPKWRQNVCQRQYWHRFSMILEMPPSGFKTGDIYWMKNGRVVFLGKIKKCPACKQPNKEDKISSKVTESLQKWPGEA